jgi:Putative prokaryotic signal transducing protein
MFCPRCRSEYRPGVRHCTHCGTDLVPELRPEPRPEYVSFEQILSTFNPADIAVIKSILDAEEIVYYFLGEHFNYVRPWGDPARLMIRQDQAETARSILADLNLSFTGPNLRKQSDDHEA